MINLRMSGKFGVFFIMVFMSIALCTTTVNFVSAKGVECFGGSKVDHYFCVLTNDDGTIIVSECIRNEEGISECTTLNSKPTPPGIEQALQNTVKEGTQTNTNDSKDLGRLKNDDTNRGTDLSPESAQSSPDGTNSSISKKYNRSSTLTQLNDLEVARGLH